MLIMSVKYMIPVQIQLSIKVKKIKNHPKRDLIVQ